MPLPDAHNPYNFDEYLAWRDGFNFFEDDAFLLRTIRHFAGELSEEDEADVRAMAKTLSFRWVRLADTAGRPENAPYMQHFDGYNRRIDRIVRPAQTLELERDVWSEAMFSERTSAWKRFIKIFLTLQLGEAGINCAHCCTAGLVLILERFADSPELRRILGHLKEGESGDFAIGAQFLSEIQGGSDVQANRVEAVHTDAGWRIYGTKFYCSAAHADYAIITAKPRGSHDVAVFVVPSWLPGDKNRERRNGYVINKLKSKLGTRELPTAEITYDGALAYPVGDLKRGLANIMAIVIAHSRFVTGLGACAQMVRVAREAKRYSEWRTAFGVTIGRFGLVAQQVQQLERYARRGTAGSFKLHQEVLEVAALDETGHEDSDALVNSRRRFRLRMLIMLHKLVSCADSASSSETAMSILGGHGLMEDFSALPRLFRDAVVLNGAWEGPRNLLLTRIFMDMQRATQRGYPPGELVADLLPSASREARRHLADELAEVLDYPHLTATDPTTLAICTRWDRLCGDLYHGFQDQAVAEVEGASTP